MIQDLLLKLKAVTDRIILLKELLSETTGLRSGMPQGIPLSTSGHSDPTEAAAFRREKLRLDLQKEETHREELLVLLEGEKKKCPSKRMWSLLWDHYYLGLKWKAVANRNGMGESAAKMRVLRYLNERGRIVDSG